MLNSRTQSTTVLTADDRHSRNQSQFSHISYKSLFTASFILWILKCCQTVSHKNNFAKGFQSSRKDWELRLKTQACVCETACCYKASAVLESKAPPAGYHCTSLHLLVLPLHVFNGALPLVDQFLPLSMGVTEVFSSSVQSNLFHNHCLLALSQGLTFFAQNLSLNKYNTIPTFIICEK